ncbi:MAG TPA: hypothetical protein VKG03_02905, partial [Solirubrobacterales bacterium]|nr:hypothetical protein [Solirubrobacterales bacterium]
MTATLTIQADEREALHGLLVRRLTILAEHDRKLAEREGVTAKQLYESFGDDLRLFDEVGLGFLIEPSAVELTMPPGRLVAVLKRLRRDARRAPCEARHEREPQETDEDRWRRFRRGVEVCEELLGRLDSPERDGKDPASISAASPKQVEAHELTSYVPVTDVFVLAAAERAECHEQDGAVLTSDLTE